MLPHPCAISTNLTNPITPFLFRKTIPFYSPPWIPKIEGLSLLLSTNRDGNGKSNLVSHLIAQLFLARVRDQFDPPEWLKTCQTSILPELSKSGPPDLADPPPLSPGPNPGPEFPRPPMPSPPAPGIPLPATRKPPPDKLPPLPRPDITPPAPPEFMPPPSIPPNILPTIGPFGSFTLWEYKE